MLSEVSGGTSDLWGGSVVVGGLLGHFLDSMLPQYMALPVREKYNSNQGGRLNFGILTVFMNIRPAKVVNHTPWSCIMHCSR